MVAVPDVVESVGLQSVGLSELGLPPAINQLATAGISRALA